MTKILIAVDESRFFYLRQFGDALKNYELSLERVKSVKQFLVEKGIEESRLKETGFGGTKPLVGFGTDDERKVNRRVEFVVTKNK